MIIEEVALFKSEVESLGPTFDQMRVAVARSVNIVDSAAEYDQAIENRMAARRRTQNLARLPNFQDTREVVQEGTIYGSPDHVGGNIQVLRDISVEYVLLNWPAGISTLRQFAKNVMPGFADGPKVAGKP